MEACPSFHQRCHRSGSRLCHPVFHQVPNKCVNAQLLHRLRRNCNRSSASMPHHWSIGPSKDERWRSPAPGSCRLRLRRDGRWRYHRRLGSRSRPQSFDPCFERLEGIAHTNWVLQGTPRRHRTGTTPRNHLRARCKGTRSKCSACPSDNHTFPTTVQHTVS